MLTSTIQDIHNTDYKVVISVTGGGSGAINQLLQYGRGSSTLLEAIVPYSENALISFLEGTPDKYCSEATARAMAMQSFNRAASISDSCKHDKIYGLGATFKLAKIAVERVGRKHIGYIAVTGKNFTNSFKVSFQSNLDRVAEEYYAASLIIDILAYHCKVKLLDDLMKWRHNDVYHITSIEGSFSDPSSELYNLYYGSTINIRSGIGRKSNELIFPGSFNPIHAGHVEMMRIASEYTGLKVDLELSISNIDKPKLDHLTLQERLIALKENKEIQPYLNDILITNAPLYVDKVKIAPHNPTFIIGTDSIKRLSDNITDYQLDVFEEYHVRFLVFSRKKDKNWYNEIDNELKAFIINMSKYYTDTGISSTKIRASI